MNIAPANWKSQVLRGVVIGIAVVAAFQLGGMFMDAQWSKETEKLFADNARLNHSVDSLQSALAFTTKADSAKADTIAQATKRIKQKAHDVAATVPDTCKPVVTTMIVYVDSLAEANDTLQAITARQRASIASLSRTVDTLQTQNARLETVIRSVNKRDYVFGIVPLPSRTQSLVAGVLIGAVAVVALK